MGLEVDWIELHARVHVIIPNVVKYTDIHMLNV